MPRTTLTDRGQLTLPSEIRKRIQAAKGDLFDVDVVDGNVVMTPLRLVRKKGGDPARRKPVDLSKYIGALSGTYGDTVEKADAYLRRERDSWD